MKRIPGPLAIPLVLVVTNLILLIAGCASVPRIASDVAEPYGIWDVVSENGEAVTHEGSFAWWFELWPDGSLRNVLIIPAVPAGGSETGRFSLGEEEDGCGPIEVVIDHDPKEEASGSICGEVLTLEYPGTSLVLHKRPCIPSGNRTQSRSSESGGLLVWETMACESPADPYAIVLAGSSGTSPPPFRSDAFWGITSVVEKAFPFILIPDGSYNATELQIAADHYERLAGSVAQFSIKLDDSGKPGVEIATFQLRGISTERQVLSAVPSGNVTLDSGTQYWLVGATPRGQVNWSLGDNAFGTAAYRVSGGDWIIQDNSYVCAFAILGSPVPEPVTGG